MSVIRLIALVIGLISCILIVIGLAIPYWIYMVDKDFPVAGTTFHITANIGFWDYCLNIELYGVIRSRCGKLYESDRNDITDASAAMLFIGMLMMAGSVVVGATSRLCMKENKLLPIVGGVCALFAGACMLIGVALYGHEYWQKIDIDSSSLTISHMYGPSFYMAIVATLFALVSGGMQIASRTISESSVQASIF